MTLVRVALAERGYDILIEHGLLDRASEYLGPFARRGRIVVVSDETVWAVQGERLTAGLAPVEAVPVLVPAGEASKSWALLGELVSRLVELDLGRRDHLVAFGGGVIGDLAGFAAAIVNRGCPFVQVPTTLLAQVDSSVGGKTGVNLPAGKNLVGSFHQPSFVLIDPSCLDTLSERERRSGYAEIVKYALIEDPRFFEWLERHGRAVLSGEAGALRHAIAVSVAGKARIVEADERETGGKRALLNLGHTFAHALEAEAGYSGRLLHGEAVAVGLVLALSLSAERALCSRDDVNRTRALLEDAGLPVSLAAIGMRHIGERLVHHMRRDKKKDAGRLPFILARSIGEAFVDLDVDLADVSTFLDREP